MAGTDLAGPVDQVPAGGSGRQRVLITLAVAALVLVAIVAAVALAGPREPAPAAVTPSRASQVPTAATSEPFGPVVPTATTGTPTPKLTSPKPSRTPTAAPTPSSTPTPIPTPSPTPTLAPPPADRTGAIVSAVAGGPCADLRSDNATAGNVIWSYTCNRTPAQIWTLRTDGTLRVHSTWCLQPADKASAPGTGLVIGECDGSAAQQWRVAPGGQIRQQVTGLCMTLPQPATQVPLIMDSCTEATGQNWTTP